MTSIEDNRSRPNATPAGCRWKLYQYDQHIARYLRQDLVHAELSPRVDGFDLTNHSMRRSFLTLLADAGVEEGVRFEHIPTLASIAPNDDVNPRRASSAA